MKANFLNTHSNNKLSSYNMQRLRHKHDTSVQTAKNNEIRPAQAISFGGSALSITQNVSGKLIESQPINKLVKFVSENEAAYNAIYSLLIAGILKPMFVLAQTGDDDKDGQIIATKNFLQAFIGSFLGLTVGGGFFKKVWDKMDNNLKLFKYDEKTDVLSTLDETSKEAKKIAKKLVSKDHNKFADKFAQAQKNFASEKGIKKLGGFLSGLTKEIDYQGSEEEIAAKAKEFVANFNKNHKEALERNPEFLKKLVKNRQKVTLNPSSAKRELKKGCQLAEGHESLWKNSTGTPTAILKAKISSLLLPGVMAFLFAKRNLENEAKKREAASQKSSSTLLLNSQTFKKSQDKFSNFAPLAKDNKDEKIAFKGLLDKAIDKTTAAVETLSMSKGGQKAAEGMTHFKKPSARMADFESIGITAYWVGNTMLSKRIDPDQKLGLNVHTVLVTAISSTAALIIDTLTDGFVNKAEEAYLQRLKDTAQSASEKLKETANMDEVKKLVKKNCSKLYKGDKVIDAIADKNFLESIGTKDFTTEIENLACEYGKKLSKFKSLTIFTLVVRFLVPVLTVKVSKKIKNMIIDWTKNRRLEKEAKAKGANPQESEVENDKKEAKAK